MAFFFPAADNSALLQAIFDQDLAKVRQLLPEADCREGGGRLLRTAVVYSTQAIVEVIAAHTPAQFYAGAVREGLEHNKHLPLIRLIPLAKFKNGAKEEISLAFSQEAWECLMSLLLHSNIKRDSALWVQRLTKRTPLEVVRRLHRLMGPRLCQDLPLTVWTLAGTNPQAFEVFAPHLNLQKMHALVLTKMYTRLTKDSQDLIEKLLLEQGHRVAI